MQDLRVIGVENGALLVTSDDGGRFRLPIDEVLQAKLHQSPPEPGAGRKLAPREIQAHIRSGMSAQDVASITGVPLDYIQKFEGPVLAEREFVVQTALNVPVHTAMDTDPMSQGTTFGSAILERLHDLGAMGERWASWKDLTTGWIVKLAFTADQVEHDARWRFDPKKLALAPMNNEAITLSQQGEAQGALIPRLRAVSIDEPVAANRFDSGAFALDEEPAEPAPSVEVIVRVTEQRNIEQHEEPAVGNQTADLLEALRRRRGERESATFDEDDIMSSHPSTGTIRLVDVQLPESEPDTGRATAPQPIAKARKGRAAMPSWDEIVFGARPDDDLA
ncbi:MAG: septation protein SepH [Rhodoglobus sp.]